MTRRPALAEPVEPRLLLATFTVTTSADSGPGTLRQAIIDANAASGADVINFDLPPEQLAVRPTSPLPAVTDRVLIDGGSAERVGIEGELAGPTADGLRLEGQGSAVVNLWVGRFGDDGIVLAGAGGHAVAGCIIGTNAAERADLGNGGQGIEINSSDNVVGRYQRMGGETISGNTISGNALGGVLIREIESSGPRVPAENNRIVASQIGLTPAGFNFFPNRGDGVNIQTANNVVGGTAAADRNVISGNSLSNVFIYGAAATGNVVTGNYIGPDKTGQVFASGGGIGGVTIFNAPGNRIGGADAADVSGGNLISGILGDGVFIAGATARGNTVIGNRIGTQANGGFSAFNRDNGVHVAAPDTYVGYNVIGGNGTNTVLGNGVLIESPAANVRVVGNSIGVTPFSGGQSPVALPNRGHGVHVRGSDGNLIAFNRISANNGNGITLSSFSDTEHANNNRIEGNEIGLAIGNGGHGVEVGPRAEGNFIGGPVAGDGPSPRNVISGNGMSGVMISSQNNSVQGNYIGTNAAGFWVVNMPRQSNGVIVADGGNLIGGSRPGEGNVIAGYSVFGIGVYGLSGGNTIAGNQIGLDEPGLIAEGRGAVSVASAGNLIGGTAPGAGNYIADSMLGIVLIGRLATGNRVQGNTIGNLALRNFGHAITIEDGASFNTIGGAEPGAGNEIAYNSGDGVHVDVDSAGNAILGNSIHHNDQAGIDLLPTEGSNPNDLLDGDTGGNDLQNYPELTAALADPVAARVRGTFHGWRNSDFRLEFFASRQPDPAGYGQGERFVGAVTVTTDDAGNVAFDATLDGGFVVGEHVTATATEVRTGAFGSTSEFSRSVPAVAQPPRVVDVFVGGALSSSFVAELREEGLGDDRGYRIPAGARGLDPLPWSVLNSVSVRFSRAVSVQAEDLTVHSAAGIDYRVVSMQYDRQTDTANWVFDRPFADYPRRRRTADRVTFELDGDAPDGVRAAEFGPPVYLAGGDYSREVVVVPGDANRNGNVSPTDYGTVRSGTGRSTTDEGTSPNHYTVYKDVNANGNVSPTDVGVVRGNTGADLIQVPDPSQSTSLASISEELFSSSGILN